MKRGSNLVQPFIWKTYLQFFFMGWHERALATLHSQHERRTVRDGVFTLVWPLCLFASSKEI